MCCETHDLRSFVLKYRGEQEHLAPAENRRCQCTELGKWRGQRCVMEADAEDLLCAWCRETDHQLWYNQTARSGDAAVQAYYRQHGAVTFGRPSRPAVEWQSARWEGSSPAGEFRDEYPKWRDAEYARYKDPGELPSYREFIEEMQSGQLSVSPQGLSEAANEIRSGLEGVPPGQYVTGKVADTDSAGLSFRPQPFEFTPDEMSAMRAATGKDQLGNRLRIISGEPVTFKFEGMTAEQVMKYIRGKYGA